LGINSANLNIFTHVHTHTHTLTTQKPSLHLLHVKTHQLNNEFTVTGYIGVQNLVLKLKLKFCMWTFFLHGLCKIDI